MLREVQSTRCDQGTATFSGTGWKHTSSTRRPTCTRATSEASRGMAKASPSRWAIPCSGVRESATTWPLRSSSPAIFPPKRKRKFCPSPFTISKGSTGKEASPTSKVAAGVLPTVAAPLKPGGRYCSPRIWSPQRNRNSSPCGPVPGRRAACSRASACSASWGRGAARAALAAGAAGAAGEGAGTGLRASTGSTTGGCT